MIKNILVTIFAVFSLTACLEPTPVVTAQKDAQALVNTMTFVKNSNTNLCYGVVTTEKNEYKWSY